jgi:hypothetical protein
VERLVIDDAPWIAQHYYVSDYLFQPYVQGAEINLLGSRTMPLKRIWFKKSVAKDSMGAMTDVQLHQ